MCVVYVVYAKSYAALSLFVGSQIGIHVTTMAEAAAIIGLVASIASLINLTAKVISRLRESTSKSSELPESFRSLLTRLPLLTATLQQIQSQAEDGRFSDDVAQALKAVVDDTSEQVSDIHVSLSKILPSDGASKFERALKALKGLAKEDKIKRALEKVYGCNGVLVLHQTTQHVVTGDRILEALSRLSLTPPTLPCPSSNIPFGRDPDFVDRGAMVDKLHRKCTLPASRTVLVGLGGVG